MTPKRYKFWLWIVRKFIIFTFAGVGLLAFMDVVMFNEEVIKSDFMLYLIKGVVVAIIFIIWDWEDEKNHYIRTSEEIKE